MSSSRFPGKVLAPLHGKPVILHLIERLHKYFTVNDVIVLTSIQPSDDPLVAYLQSMKIPVFRGDLLNTFNRFREALNVFPCDCFYRVSGDSPLFNSQLFPLFESSICDQQPDIVTNVFPRSFPKGQSLELIRSEAFMRINPNLLTPSESEHVTPYFYNNPEQFTIVNITNPNEGSNQYNVVVDTIEDLKWIDLHWDQIMEN